MTGELKDAIDKSARIKKKRIKEANKEIQKRQKQFGGTIAELLDKLGDYSRKQLS